MAKQRMIAGYALQQSGIIAPGEPIMCHVKIPHNAEPRKIQVDPNGNFVLFAEVWSHPEGTEVKFCEVEYAICQPNKVFPAGSWDYYDIVQAGPAVFIVLTRGKPKILQ